MPATIEAVFDDFIECINAERWASLPVRFPLNLNEEHVADGAAFGALVGRAGTLRVDANAVTADRATGYLGATSLGTIRLAGRDRDGDGGGGREGEEEGEGEGEGEEAGRTIRLMEQYILRIEDGRITELSMISVVPETVVARQPRPGEPGYATDAELLRSYYDIAAPTSAAADSAGREEEEEEEVERGRDGDGDRGGQRRLSTSELESTYRAYIGCINARTTATGLPRFCHGHVTHNATRLSLDGYRALIQQTLAAVPDIVFAVDILVADEVAQRVAARLRFSGTPTGELAGAKPTGRSVHFCEYVTYAFRDGKIDRVWSIVDWGTYRWQLAQ
ncbi:putative ester cyclase [Rosellinia necatrix]|uniref:Putative ester cyclase n=1 Tax=Rosellinia necatrix TaxID=77044 RepID=A0A1S8A740_ROSNE|nr:putative ester cyclase [Rosellinia necatrix]